MNLYLATSIVSALFFLGGIGFFFTGFKGPAMRFLRSQTAAYVLGAIAIVWFMWILYNLTEADFGNYKFLLMAIFGGAGLLAFKHLPDFLSVRALCVVMLLSSRHFIDAAFMQEPVARLVMVSLVYFFIIVWVYFGCLPYRMRDLFIWLFKEPARAKGFAAFMCACGAACAISMLFY